MLSSDAVRENWMEYTTLLFIRPLRFYLNGAFSSGWVLSGQINSELVLFRIEKSQQVTYRSMLVTGHLAVVLAIPF